MESFNICAGVTALIVANSAKAIQMKELDRKKGEYISKTQSSQFMTLVRSACYKPQDLAIKHNVVESE